MTRLPCPEWCVTLHSEDIPGEIVIHGSANHPVPVKGPDGADHPNMVVYACVCQVEGEDPGVFISAPGEDLSPDNAVTFAVAILNAAAVAAGGRLDSLISAELDRLVNGRGEAA